MNVRNVSLFLTFSNHLGNFLLANIYAQMQPFANIV